MGICTATAHPNVHCRPQLLLASLPDIGSTFAYVGVDCARGLPVRITPPVLTLLPQIQFPQPEWPFRLETQNWFAATPSSSHASGMQAYASFLCAIVNAPVVYSPSFSLTSQRCQAARPSPHDRICLPYPVPSRPPSLEARRSRCPLSFCCRKFRGNCEQRGVLCVFGATCVVVQRQVCC